MKRLHYLYVTLLRDTSSRVLCTSIGGTNVPNDLASPGISLPLTKVLASIGPLGWELTATLPAKTDVASELLIFKQEETI